MSLMGARARPLRFVLAGGFNTAVSFGSYAAGLRAGLSLPLASLVGVLAGIAVGFLTQGRFVFGQAGWSRLPRFLLAWATMYGLHLAIVTGLGTLGVNAYAGGVVALVVITLLSYFVLRNWVFGPGRAAAGAAAHSTTR